MFELHSCRILVLYIFKVLLVSLEYYIRTYGCYTLPLTLVSFRSGGIRDKCYSSRHVDLRESIIYQQYRIVYIIMIYVFCTLLKYTDSNCILTKSRTFFIGLNGLLLA